MEIRKPFDPVVVREFQTRLNAHQQIMTYSHGGSKALMWFNEYAWFAGKRSPTITVRSTLIAASTPGAEHAQRYVSLAAEEFSEQILTRAIELANEDFKAGQEALAKKKKED